MKSIRTVLIDDEISAIRTLRGMLVQYFPEISIVGTACTLNEGVNKVKEHLPDLVFLDIEMPPFGNGFDFLKMCSHLDFGVIFTTAYPRYAVQAINEFQPWGYLVKPFSITDLKKALETAGEKFSAQQEGDAGQPKPANILIPDSRKGNVVIQTEQILFCRAGGATVDIYYLKKNGLNTMTASKTLKEIETLLPKDAFCRSHHSYLVNFQHIERYEQTGRNGVIYLSDGSTVPISVLKMEDFKERFFRFLRKL